MAETKIVAQMAPIIFNGENYYILEEWDKNFENVESMFATSLLCSQFNPIDVAEADFCYRTVEDRENFEMAIKNEVGYYEKLSKFLYDHMVAKMLEPHVNDLVNLEMDYADFNLIENMWSLAETPANVFQYNIQHYMKNQNELRTELEERILCLKHVSSKFHLFEVLEAE